MKFNQIPIPWWELQPQVYELYPKWHLKYYDGPLSGICVSEDDVWYYVESAYFDTRSIWCAWKLTEEEKQYEQAVHKAFQEYVGVHTDYDENGDRALGDLKPQTEWDKFYKDPQWMQDKRNYMDRDFDAICRRPF